MSRIRTIKPEFWGHPKVARISRDARLLFLGLLNESDDQGRLLGSTKRIAGVVFPHDEDVTARKIDGWLAQLEAVCLIHRYEIEGTPYILLCGFEEHQKITHPTPSRLPSPSGTIPELFPPDLGTGKGTGKGRAQDAPPEVGQLVAGYVDDYRAERNGSDPPRNWRGAAGKAVKAALADGVSVEDVARCLGVIAHESKNPSTLPYVLADYHAGRERRMR